VDAGGIPASRLVRVPRHWCAVGGLRGGDCRASVQTLGDLIRLVWTDEGPSFWLTCAFLAIWAGAVLYVGATAAVGLFGEIPIAKDGDRGGIFTGIGRVGWTHRLQWSEFDGVAERDVDSVSTGSSTHTSHYVGLNGPGKRYKFGSEMTKQQQVFVIAFFARACLRVPRDAGPRTPRPVRR
jgi:hypothetical protein